MKCATRLTICSVALAVLMPMQTVFGAQTLKGEQIRSMITGRAMTFVSGNGKWGGRAVWHRNGTITGSTTYGSFTFKWSGTWWVKGNKYCRSLSAQGRNDSKCQRVRKLGPKRIQFVNDDGTIGSTSTLK
jgi:hypothetical protein